jgi:acyl-CoA synthetase (NDP forming)
MNFQREDLNKFFNPRHIAIVGVPRTGSRFGGGTFMGKFIECGFPGTLYPINPKADMIQGIKAYPDLSSLPETPDLAIVAVAARFVPATLEECARIGLRHVHVLSSGFKEIGSEEGRQLEARVASIARENDLLVIGPNCMGPYCPSSRLTAWGAIPGMSGPVGVISQSGGITQRLTEYLCSLGIGVDKAVSIGNAAVLDSPDYLEYLADDEKIRVIAMYLESVKDGRRFLEVAKRTVQEKPIVVWKGGETEVGAKTVASHTGTLAGESRLWDSFYRQAGITHVQSLNEWVDAVMAFCMLPVPAGKKVFLIGGGGGNSVANGDACIREGLDVPPLSDDTMARLRETVPEAGSIAGNPLDEWRVFEDSEYLLEILELGLSDPVVDMIVVDRMIPRKAFHMTGEEDAAPAVIDFVRRHESRKPVVFTADSEGGDLELAAKGAALRAQFCREGFPAYPSLERAARALTHLIRYYSRIGSQP